MVSNFWRALQVAPDDVAKYADWPVNECDLHARHLWLVNEGRLHVERLKTEPDYFDAKIAGWWVAGVCGWIGSGYCSGEGPWRSIDGELSLGDAGRGINKQIPHLSNAGQGIFEWFDTLATRLRRVRVASGDWTRVVTESVTTRHGLTGVFLDPPYGDEIEQTRVYATDSGTVSADVRAWCHENGGDPLLRIALCGYEGEGHDDLLDAGWTAHRWRAAGGYGGGRGGTGDANRVRERIYFSPACITEEGLF